MDPQVVLQCSHCGFKSTLKLSAVQTLALPVKCWRCGIGWLTRKDD